MSPSVRIRENTEIGKGNKRNRLGKRISRLFEKYNKTMFGMYIAVFKSNIPALVFEIQTVLYLQCNATEFLSVFGIFLLLNFRFSSVFFCKFLAFFSFLPPVFYFFYDCLPFSFLRGLKSIFFFFWNLMNLF